VQSNITRKVGGQLVKLVMRKQQFCGDTLNLFAREDQNYHWSRSYWYYSSLLGKENNKVWTSGIVLAGCVPEVFECKDILTWCIDKFIQNRRVITLQSSSPISLVPSIFREMLKLPEPNMVYKGEEARNFLKRKNNGIELLQEYLHDPASMPEDISRIQVSSLKNPYKEISWLFTRIVGQDSMETIPRLALYILHFTVHENAIFDWAKIISNEITAQLTNFKTEKKFYMSSYLLFSITYCHTFEGLNIARRVRVKVDHVTMWYQALWRQRVDHHFYEVYNDFVSKFKNYSIW
jgi:hypothetical protein